MIIFLVYKNTMFIPIKKTRTVGSRYHAELCYKCRQNYFERILACCYLGGGRGELYNNKSI